MIRLDMLVMQNGLAASRQRAKTLIINGKIQVDGMICTKPAKLTEETAELVLIGEGLRYVGRGGFKLEAVLERQQLSLKNCICMDIGASTGGFTDCMLQHGAEKVYAVDVGHGQLAASLRENDRVICMEGTDIRTLQRETILDRIDFISVVFLLFLWNGFCLIFVGFCQKQELLYCSLSHSLRQVGQMSGKRVLCVLKRYMCGVLQTVCMALERHGLHVRCFAPRQFEAVLVMQSIWFW